MADPGEEDKVSPDPDDYAIRHAWGVFVGNVVRKDLLFRTKRSALRAAAPIAGGQIAPVVVVGTYVERVDLGPEDLDTLSDA